jgi:hypothetical protein
MPASRTRWTLIYWLSAAIVAQSIMALPFLARYGTSFYSGDMPGFFLVLEQMDEKFDYPITVPIRADITKDPSATDRIAHNVYVRGPKIVFYALVYLFHAILKALGVHSIGTAFTLLSWTCACSTFVAVLFLTGTPERWSAPVSLSAGLSLLIFSHLYLFHLSNLYYVLNVPNYVHPAALFTTLSLILVWRFEGMFSQFAAGLLTGFLFGITSAAPVFVTALFGSNAIKSFRAPANHKTGRIISPLMFLAGGATSLTLLEFFYRLKGTSFLLRLWLHVRENLFQNHLGHLYPWSPVNTFHLLTYAIPFSFFLFLLQGIAQADRNVLTATDRGMYLFLGLLFALFSISPSTPLFRSVAPMISISLGMFFALNYRLYENKTLKSAAFGFALLLTMLVSGEAGYQLAFKLNKSHLRDIQNIIDRLEREEDSLGILGFMGK